jgi:hypothetical protein
MDETTLTATAEVQRARGILAELCEHDDLLDREPHLVSCVIN